ncbi:shikimate dehydrogenase family protein [Acetobacter fallax]|uniref:Shikimate dehydrogenase n=1 Tax=Acetobacter fallax TaxID=1737473 RepID=A0ABX0KEP6_9PROT|nr:shikimate dehydrogenase [Acetobacter fallax]NHO33403.1 shikimate dehydrogenase [Acetobacter fallax]NHO37022.1 shikimate dehydrogenase [Acetobacter fallax]
MLWKIDGNTKIYPIVGDPVSQVKSPQGMSEGFRERGINALCIPAHVCPNDFPLFGQMLLSMQNVPGFIATIPHKFATHDLCRVLSPRADILGAANVARRLPDGGWYGDMLDGEAFLQALRNAGAKPEGASALLTGAGGAGSAIAYALLNAGVTELGIYDPDPERLENLIRRLEHGGMTAQAHVRAVSSPDAHGFSLVCNASPAGMKPDDPLPVPRESLQADMVVGDVITEPVVTPLIAAALEKGCHTATGIDMFHFVRDFMLDFFVESLPGQEAA